MLQFLSAKNRVSAFAVQQESALSYERSTKTRTDRGIVLVVNHVEQFPADAVLLSLELVGSDRVDVVCAEHTFLLPTQVLLTNLELRATSISIPYGVLRFAWRCAGIENPSRSPPRSACFLVDTRKIRHCPQHQLWRSRRPVSVIERDQGRGGRNRRGNRKQRNREVRGFLWHTGRTREGPR